MNESRNSRKFNFAGLALACVALCTAAAFAQGGSMSPYQDEQDGVSAGGKWMQRHKPPIWNKKPPIWNG